MESELQENIEEQEDEKIVLESVLGEDFIQISKRNFKIIIFKEDDEERKDYIEMSCCLKDSYPSKEPLDANLYSQTFIFDNEFEKKELIDSFEPGVVCVFDWVNTIKSRMENFKKKGEKSQEEINKSKIINERITEFQKGYFYGKKIIVSNPVSQKKSTFIAYGVYVQSREKALEFRRILKLNNKKFANATHNMLAFRVKKNGLIEEKAYEDGEHGAGSIMSKTMELLDAQNLVVVVTRWYGGILLGGLRFKLIKDQTIDIIKQFQSEKSEQ